MTGSRSNYDQLAKGAEVFTVFPDSFSNFMAAQGRMDAVVAAMSAAMQQSFQNTSAPIASSQNAALARNNAAFLAGWPGPTSSGWLAASGIGWIGGGISSMLFAGALAAGAVATAPVTATGMAIFGVGATVIGGTQVFSSMKIAGGK